MKVNHTLGRCSFWQSWSPGMIFDGQYMVRPVQLILLSESLGQPLCAETMARKPNFEEVLGFFEKCFASREGAPPELVVPSEQLADRLRGLCPDTRIVMRSEDSSVPRFWPTDHVPYSVLATLGERKALRAYRRGVQFLESEIWREFSDEEVVSFTCGQQQFGLLVTGRSRWQEMGFTLYPGLKQASRMKRPLAAFGPGNSLLVHYADLNFLDQHGMAMPRDKYPMFAFFGVDAGFLKEMSWLLEHLPEFIRSRQTVKGDKRRLELTRVRVEPGLVGREPWDVAEAALSCH